MKYICKEQDVYTLTVSHIYCPGVILKPGIYIYRCVYTIYICIVDLEFHSEINVFEKYILVLIPNWYIFLDIDN